MTEMNSSTAYLDPLPTHQAEWIGEQLAEWNPHLERSLTSLHLVVYIGRVPQVNMCTYYGTVSYNGMGGKLELTRNLCFCLGGYLQTHYMFLPPAAKEDITTSINAFLRV
ncbi:hypothetical protein Y1Q_0004766 [Alligator mississippiensis]|uniref:Uncharacterized protein n=1 Tax=Alligator mississippiensis TaxID=8496 RepID=A0A151NLJ1_ALLMI|nr:hypothetical protein Y1Q_0004766 [Alligator mississippiensis]